MPYRYSHHHMTYKTFNTPSHFPHISLIDTLSYPLLQHLAPAQALPYTKPGQSLLKDHLLYFYFKNMEPSEFQSIWFPVRKVEDRKAEDSSPAAQEPCFTQHIQLRSQVLIIPTFHTWRLSSVNTRCPCSQCFMNSHSGRKESTPRKSNQGPMVNISVPHVMSYVT